MKKRAQRKQSLSNEVTQKNQVTVKKRRRRKRSSLQRKVPRNQNLPPRKPKNKKQSPVMTMFLWKNPKIPKTNPSLRSLFPAMRMITEGGGVQEYATWGRGRNPHPSPPALRRIMWIASLKWAQRWKLLMMSSPPRRDAMLRDKKPENVRPQMVSIILMFFFKFKDFCNKKTRGVMIVDSIESYQYQWAQ